MAKKDRIQETQTEEAGAAVVETAPAGPKTAKRVDGITPESVVTLVATVNPKREGSQSYDRFEHYSKLEEGATVAQAIEAGLTMGDIRYDVIHGYITVAGANVTEYEVTPRGEKAADEAAPGADTVENNGF